jgi:hypothetical protein
MSTFKYTTRVINSPSGLLNDIGVKECVNFWFSNKMKPKAHSLTLTKKKKTCKLQVSK